MGGERLIFWWLALMVIISGFGISSIWRITKRYRLSVSPGQHGNKSFWWWMRQIVKFGITLFAMYQIIIVMEIIVR